MEMIWVALSATMPIFWGIKKSAGLLEDDSGKNPRSPITDFDAKLILVRRTINGN